MSEASADEGADVLRRRDVTATDERSEPVNIFYNC